MNLFLKPKLKLLVKKLKTPRIRRTLKILLIGSVLVGCQTANRNMKLYAGNHLTAALHREQDGEILSCTYPEFSKMVCMTWTDFNSLAALAGKCSE